MIRPAIITDSQSIARLHVETLSDSFLAELGFKFLNNLYIFLIKRECVLVYEEQNEVKGFVSFSGSSTGMMKRFLINCPGCILILASKTILDPANLKRFWETFRAPFISRKSEDTHASKSLPSGELLSISVNPDCQASGIGSQLIKALEGFLLHKNISQYRVVVGENLEGANKFYLKNGFEIVTQIKVHGDNLSNVYLKNV